MAACALAAALCAAAGAQTPAPGWVLVVRIVPNPVPLGRCAGISIEMQDADGYRTTSTSNGESLDFHRFKYTVDTTNFQWRDGNSTDGILCPRTPGTPSHTTVAVTLPDGLTGSAELSSIAPGTSAPPVQYAPQAPLRGHGVPLARRSAAVATAQGGSPPGASGAAPGASRAGSGSVATPADGTAPTKATRDTPGSPLGKVAEGKAGTYRPQSVDAAALQMTGMALSFAALHVDGGALQMIGNGVAFSPALVTATPLGMVGNGFSPQPLTVEAAALGMTGNGVSFAPLTIEAAKLSLTGQTP